METKSLSEPMVKNHSNINAELRNIMAHVTHAGNAVLGDASRNNLYNLKMALKNINKWMAENE